MGHTLQLGDAQVDENKLADLCRHYGVRQLSLFGSAVRGEMRPGSDIDVMEDVIDIQAVVLHKGIAS